MATTAYKSTDASAPTLSGTAGDLVSLLDAILVNGYGSKAAAGWTKSFTGTNKAVYKQGAGSGFYLDVDDSGPGAAGAQEARLRGYEAMTGVGTGTNAFPTAAQLAAGDIVRKSAAAGATTRAWKAFANSRAFHLFIATGDVAGNYTYFFFGDVQSFVSGDSYKTLIYGRYVENSSADATTQALGSYVATPASSFVPLSQLMESHYMPRGYTGTGGAVKVGKAVPNFLAASTGNVPSAFATPIQYPNPSDGGLYMCPVFVYDTTTSSVKSIRGEVPGLFCAMHAITSFADGDTFSGATGGEYDGRTFEIVKTVAGGNGLFIIETSDWPT